MFVKHQCESEPAIRSIHTRIETMLRIILLLNFILFPIFSKELLAREKITLLHYNDLHAHLTTHRALVRHGDPCRMDPEGTARMEMKGGIARLATLVQSIRKEKTPSILMNIGDTFHGGVESFYTIGNAIVDPVNHLGIDVGVPGNWDFAYGPAVFRKRYAPDGPFPFFFQMMLPSFEIKRANFPNLAANLKYKSLNWFDPSKTGKSVLPPTLIIQKGEVRVGFIGITSDMVPRMHFMLSKGFDFLQGEENYKDLIETLAAELRREGVNLVVVMSELGIHKDYRLANEINRGSVDVFFSAHTHEVTPVPLTSKSGALVVEAGDDGYLGRMDITFDESKETYPRFQWTLIPITAEIPEDPGMVALVRQAREPFLQSNPALTDPTGSIEYVLDRPITTVVGKSNGLISRIDSMDSSFNRAFAELLRQKAKIHVALTPGFRFDSPVQSGGEIEGRIDASGEITIEDIFRFFPVGYTLARGTTTGENLKRILENVLTTVYSLDFFKQSGGWVDGISGIIIKLKKGNMDYDRIDSMVLKNNEKEISPDKTISIAGCQRRFEDSDVLCSHHGFENIEELINEKTGHAYSPQELLIESLQDHPLEETENNLLWEDRRDGWPQNPFVQPLPGARCTIN